jgi:GTP cyclohydrolase I
MTTPFIPSDDTTQQIAQHIQEILALLGEDAAREGLLKTPTRVGDAMQFLTQGYNKVQKIFCAAHYLRRIIAKWW